MNLSRTFMYAPLCVAVLAAINNGEFLTNYPTINRFVSWWSIPNSDIMSLKVLCASWTTIPLEWMTQIYFAHEHDTCIVEFKWGLPYLRTPSEPSGYENKKKVIVNLLMNSAITRSKMSSHSFAAFYWLQKQPFHFSHCQVSIVNGFPFIRSMMMYGISLKV